jgi:hypothetical protein
MIMSIRRLAGRMAARIPRQKRKPRKTVGAPLERAIERVIVFEPWVRNINDYISQYDITQYNRSLKIRHGEYKDEET